MYHFLLKFTSVGAWFTDINPPKSDTNANGPSSLTGYRSSTWNARQSPVIVVTRRASTSGTMRDILGLRRSSRPCRLYRDAEIGISSSSSVGFGGLLGKRVESRPTGQVRTGASRDRAGRTAAYQCLLISTGTMNQILRPRFSSYPVSFVSGRRDLRLFLLCRS